MDFKEIQDAEMEATRSIFLNDFAEVESPTVWKSVNAVHEFTIKVRPQEPDLQDVVQVTLHFKLPRQYPKLAPHITLEQPVGLSTSQQAELHDLLQASSRERLGFEMVMELAYIARDFIEENNSIVRFGQLTSLDQVRARRDIQAEQQAAEEAKLLRAKEEKERQEKEERLRAAAEKRKEELRLERMKIMQKASHEASEGIHSETTAAERFPKELRLPGRLSASTVIRGSILGRSFLGTFYNAEAVASAKHGVRVPVTLHAVDLYSPYFASVPGRRKLDTLEGLLDELLDLRHSALLIIYGSKRTIARDTVSEGTRLTIATEPLPRTSLADLLQDVGELALAKALPILKEVASALIYLHAQDVVHAALFLEHVHLGRTENGEQIVKVSGQAWYQAILDIHRSNRFLQQEPRSVPEPWLCPSKAVNPLASEPCVDIWAFGILAADLLFGARCCSRYSSPSHLLATIKEHPMFKVLAACFDPKSISAKRLLERLADVETVPKPVSDLAKAEHASSIGSTSVPEASTSLAYTTSLQYQTTFPQHQSGFFVQPRPILPASRYRTEFEEVEKLGQGGFGTVVKARNKLDNNFYAIKKVRIPSDPALEAKIVREVTIWGRLAHPGIVRYHTSWVETETLSATGSQLLDNLTSGSESAGSPKGNQPVRKGSTFDDVEDEEEEEGDYEDEHDSDLETVNPAEPFDLGSDELDFISSGNKNKNQSFSGIHFGDEDDPSQEPSRVASRNATPELQDSSVHAESPTREVRTLFIQMEFVDGETLREKIDAGLTEDEMWRILRQILDAMRFYTGTKYNIIHRDLKPSNILLDMSGKVRLADFGLAVEQSVPDQLASMSALTLKEESDLTSGVGTSLYVAPETSQRRRVTGKNAKYTHKIDMYSLGIIIFEMCWPIATGMERVEVLKALRRPDIVFPRGWDTHARSRQTKIIRWCLAHDPSKRASPSDLFGSDLLPVALEDEKITDTIALLAQPNNPHIQTVLSCLFKNDERAQDFNFDFEKEQHELINTYDSVVKRKLEHVFRLRGAVDFTPPLLIPAFGLYDENVRKPVCLLTRQGVPVQLPYDPVLPLARLVSRNYDITRLKRYSIGRVYRQDLLGGQPHAYLTASYDVVSQHQTLAAEAECLQAVDDILNETIPDLDLVHVIGHYDFLKCIVAALTPAKQHMATRALERYDAGKSTWDQFTREMQKLGIGSRGLDDLALLDICAPLAEVKLNLADLSPTILGFAHSALADVEKVVELCNGLGIQRSILVSPLLCFKPELQIGGICFQTRARKTASKKEVYAGGGRYDRLVAELAPPSARQVPRSLVGVTVAVSTLSQTMRERYSGPLAKARTDDKAARRCDIYVVSYTSGLIQGRLLIARELWKHGLAADLMYDDDFVRFAPDRIAATAKSEGIKYLVIVKATSMIAARDTQVKVKDIISSSEREVSRQDLADYLAEKLGTSATQTMLQAAAPVSNGRSMPISESFDTHLSLPSDILKRTKHKQKQMYLDDAVADVKKVLAATPDVPFFVVDIEADAFRLMSESSAWITRDESGQAFKRILDAALPARKAYIMELKNEIKAYHAKHKCHWMWLYSLKVKQAHLLNFV